MFVVIRSKIRNVINSIKDFGRPARRIHLDKKIGIDWQQPDKVRALVQPLFARGFKTGGFFVVPEMPGLSMQAVVNPDNGAFGAIYEYPKRGVWIDLVFRFEDGGGITCTTSPWPSLEDRPGFPKFRQDEQDSIKLYELLMRERPADRKIVLVKIEDFAALFEKAYADEMDWRAAKGMSERELRDTAAGTGHANASANALSFAQTIHDVQQLRNRDQSLRERFAAQQKIPAVDWTAMEAKVIVVHDRLPVDSIRGQFEKLSKAAGFSLVLPDASITSTRHQFEALNAQIPNGKGFTKLGEVTIDPLTADVWRSP